MSTLLAHALAHSTALVTAASSLNDLITFSVGKKPSRDGSNPSSVSVAHGWHAPAGTVNTVVVVVVVVVV